MITELSNLSFPEDFFCEEVRGGFYVSETMKRHWAAMLKVLSEIDKICRRHEINWYADAGTLIGVIREKGFIPWDDDLDIAMFREDYELFLTYAREELPEGYCIAYDDDLGTSRNPFKNPNPYCGITNTSNLRIDHKFLDEFYDCPFVSSVDVFPLDRVYNDPQKENDRINRAKLVYSVYWGMINKDFVKEDLSLLIPVIEKQNKVKIGTEDVQRKLLRLFIELSQECQDEDSDKVTKMFIWVMHKSYALKKAYYDSWTEGDFETTRLRIPHNYHEILSEMYKDYTKPTRGGGLHTFPCYEEHEKTFRKITGRKSCGYTFNKDKFVPKTDRKSERKRVCNLFELIHEYHRYIQNNVGMQKCDDMAVFLQDCQTAAVSIGNALEERFGIGTEAVALLEKYCEKVYEASIGWNDNTRDELDQVLLEAENKSGMLFDDSGFEILVLPCKASWWESLSDVFKHIEADTRNRISVIPTPYYYHDHAHMIGDMYRDTAEFEKIPVLKDKLTNFDAYNIEERKPDVIIIQFPYDGYSSVLGEPELLYSDNLAKFTEQLILVPHLRPDPPESEGDIAGKAMLDMVEQPAVFNSDMVVVSSKELRDYYIKTLVNMTDTELQNYWEDRICLKEDLDNRMGR